MRDEITRVPDDEADGSEAWIRDADEPELLNVEACRLDVDALADRARAERRRGARFVRA